MFLREERVFLREKRVFCAGKVGVSGGKAGVPGGISGGSPPRCPGRRGAVVCAENRSEPAGAGRGCRAAPGAGPAEPRGKTPPLPQKNPFKLKKYIDSLPHLIPGAALAPA